MTAARPAFSVVLRRLAAAALLASAGGCSMFERPPMQVSDSQLNWMNIRYKPLAPGRKPCRIEILGAGQVRVQTGTSPLVASDFSVDTEHPQWRDAAEESIGMSPQDAATILQLFVDAGVMKLPVQPDRKDIGSDVRGVAVIHGRIDGEQVRCATSEDAVIGLIERLLDHFAQNVSQ